MGKDKKQTSGVDNVTSGRQQDVWNAAQHAANQPLAPVNGAVGQALTNYQGAANAGNLGLGSLSGNAADYAKLANPYQQDVIGAVNSQWGRQADNLQNSIAARAASAGAFGGSRAAVAQGQGLGDLANSQMQQIAGLQYQGYNDTQNRAAQLANLGMGANGNAANIGQYLTQQGQAAQAHQANTLEQAYGVAGQHGQQSVQKGNLFGDILGGVSTVAGLIPGHSASASENGNNAIANSSYLNNLNTNPVMPYTGFP